MYRVTYRPELQREPENVEAASVAVEASGLVVLRQVVSVAGMPREMVVRRFTGSQVLSVEPVVPS